MSNYLLSMQYGITRLEHYEDLVSYLAKVENLPPYKVREILEGQNVGTQLKVPLVFHRGGVVVNSNRAPFSLLDEVNRSAEKYFLVNPKVTKNIFEELKTNE